VVGLHWQSIGTQEQGEQGTARYVRSYGQKSLAAGDGDMAHEKIINWAFDELRQQLETRQTAIQSLNGGRAPSTGRSDNRPSNDYEAR
jgi:hypothetical protein